MEADKDYRRFRTRLEKKIKSPILERKSIAKSPSFWNMIKGSANPTATAKSKVNSNDT
jgi:hypothetical protein